MSIDVLSLLAPVSPDLPAGSESRDTEAYEAVAAEIEKLSSMSGGGPVDWARVEEQARLVLASQSKDFLIASWLCAAWTTRHGIEGLAAGMQLHAGLATQFWDTGYPALKRLRGRRNALSWWLDRATQWLDDAILDPLPPELHATLVEAVSTLDRAWAEQDPESPPLNNLLRQVQRLDVQAAAEPAASDEAPPPADEPAQVLPGTPPPTRPSPPAAQPASAPAVAPNLAALTVSGDLATLDDIERALAPASTYLAHVGTALLDIERSHPLAIEINRCAARMPLLSAPPANGSTTALPAPPAPITDAFESIVSTGNAEGLITFCESRIAAFPYWLDLDRESARGFGLLGETGAAARREVIRHALAFTSRMPGVEDLCFADGTPFASEATRQWLAQCRAEQSGHAPVDAFDTVRQQAADALAAGHTDEATRLYQHFIRSTWSGRDRFRAQLAMTNALLGARSDIDAVPFVDALIQTCQTHALAQWEPELAAQAWQLKLKALHQALARPEAGADDTHRRALQEAQAQALQQLAALDFTQAAQWT